jgi:hypothetical protein
MKNNKRVFIATLLGLIFGFVCYSFAASSPGPLAWPIAAQIIASRALMGFAIGISRIRIHWTLHGILFGLLFSLPLAFSGLMAPESPEFSKSAMFFSTLVMGGIYGFLIELVTSVLFKAKNR